MDPVASPPIQLMTDTDSVTKLGMSHLNITTYADVAEWKDFLRKLYTDNKVTEVSATRNQGVPGP